MKPAYEVITREIAAKGAGYLLLRRCPPQELGETLARGQAELLAAGAAELYAASADPVCPLDEGRWEGFRLSHVRDMLWMERPLDQLPPAEGLTLEPLTRARGGAWLTLHNACFFDMPNSATYGLRELEEALGEEWRCGFAAADGVPVGVYELALAGEMPEIAGIAIHPDFQGKGLGRALLRAVLAELAGLGCGRCRLLVATDNGRAFSLYRREGFRAAAVKSRWFQMIGTA